MLTNVIHHKMDILTRLTEKLPDTRLAALPENENTQVRHIESFPQNFLIVNVLNFVDFMLEKGKMITVIFEKLLESTALSIRKAKLTGHTFRF